LCGLESLMVSEFSENGVATPEPVATPTPAPTSTPTPEPTATPVPTPAEPYYIEAENIDTTLSVSVKAYKSIMNMKYLYVSFYTEGRLVKTTLIKKRQPSMSEKITIPEGVDSYSCLLWYDSGEYMARSVSGSL